MLASKSTALLCRKCETAMESDIRQCRCCGQFYSAAELQILAQKQWADETRPLKVATLISSAMTLWLIWYASMHL